MSAERKGLLTDMDVRAAAPRSHEYYISDGGGLILSVSAGGRKSWQFRRTVRGRRERFSLGAWPGLSLASARAVARSCMEMVAEGKDPRAELALRESRQAAAVGDTFEKVAWAWHRDRLPGWGGLHARDQADRIARDILPFLPNRGDVPMSSLTAPDLVRSLRRVAEKGAGTAQRARSIVEQICQFAVNMGLAESDPSSTLRRALPSPKRKHFPVPETVGELAGVLRRLDDAVPFLQPLAGCALRLQALLGVRSGELCSMRWDEVDREAAEWRRVASKTHRRHVVPLSTQAISLLDLAWGFSGTSSEFVFPASGDPSRPVHATSLVQAMRRAGIRPGEFVPHSWRGVLRTFGAQECGFSGDWLEAALAHTPADRLGDTYNRTQWLEQRRGMMQRWADWLDGLRGVPAGDGDRSNVVDFRPCGEASR